MSRTHAGYDCYLGDALTYPDAIVIDNYETGSLAVKMRYPDRPNAWETVLSLSDVAFAGNQGPNGLFWQGIDRQTGEEIKLGAVYRAKSGCTQCGGR